MGRKLVLLCLLLCLLAAGACAEEQLAPLPIGGPRRRTLPTRIALTRMAGGTKDESITGCVRKRSAAMIRTSRWCG